MSGDNPTGSFRFPTDTMQCIYLDNNSTTPMLPEVWESMWPYLFEVAGNPSSAHQVGRQARRAFDDARERVAHLLGAFPDEVLFTSGATESNNLAILSHAADSGHLLASRIEHPSVVEPITHLEKQGRAVDWLSVDGEGFLDPDEVDERIRDDTRAVAVQLANHETGTIQPIQQIVKAIGGRCPLHCDATQAVGKIDVRFHELGAASLALSAHKFHGPKGIGALVVRSDVPMSPAFRGGHQQRGRRPGTEPVVLAVGLATALEIADRDRRDRLDKVTRLRQRFLAGLVAVDPVLNGPRESGMPHTVNVSFPGLKADVLLMNLDLAGVACSTGSACSSGSLLPSPVLESMGVPDDVLRSAMRFSLSFLLEEGDIDEAASRIVRVVQRLRGSDHP